MKTMESNIENKMKILQHPLRPNVIDYIENIFPNFLEMHGDRLFGDDPAVIGGIALLDGQPVTVIGQIRGRTVEENLEHNFSMCHPEGFRKSLRLMKQAEKFNRPIICFVDTLGAYPGIEAEERGQSAAIANNLMAMQEIGVPIISIIIGNGGSGGALAFLVSDETAMLESALFSVISPKGCANILWKDSSRQVEAAQMLKITAEEIWEMKLIDTVIPEPDGGAHTNAEQMSEEIRKHIVSSLKRLQKMSEKQIVRARYRKYREIGKFAPAKLFNF